MKNLLVIVAVMIFVGGVIGILNFGAGQADAAIDMTTTEIAAQESQILASTIQIELFSYGRIEGDQVYRQTSRGLGTVIQHEGRRFILTHNHWSVLGTDLDRVEIRNGVGDIQLELDGAAFHSLIRYQDGGTMLLDAPAALANIRAAELGDPTTIEAGSPVWLATIYLPNGQDIQIENAWVVEVDNSTVAGRMMLQGRKTAVISGDSGGGVWANGKLVANLWKIQIEELDWGLGISQERPTGFIVAGMQPLAGAIGLAAGDFSSDSVMDTEFERGLQP